MSPLHPYTRLLLAELHEDALHPSKSEHTERHIRQCWNNLTELLLHPPTKEDAKFKEYTIRMHWLRGRLLQHEKATEGAQCAFKDCLAVLHPDNEQEEELEKEDSSLSLSKRSLDETAIKSEVISSPSSTTILLRPNCTQYWQISTVHIQTQLRHLKEASVHSGAKGAFILATSMEKQLLNDVQESENNTLLPDQNDEQIVQYYTQVLTCFDGYYWTGIDKTLFRVDELLLEFENKQKNCRKKQKQKKKQCVGKNHSTGLEMILQSCLKARSFWRGVW